MKRVTPRHDSDCVAAALAALLELPIEEVPDFWLEGQSATRQYERVRRWLTTRGYHYYYSDCKAQPFGRFQSERHEAGVTWPPRGYWLARIARVEWIIDGDPNHIVVMKGHRCVFNPNGSLKQTKEDDVFLTGYNLLVPLDPAKS